MAEQRIDIGSEKESKRRRRQGRRTRQGCATSRKSFRPKLGPGPNETNSPLQTCGAGRGRGMRFRHCGQLRHLKLRELPLAQLA